MKRFAIILFIAIFGLSSFPLTHAQEPARSVIADGNPQRARSGPCIGLYELPATTKGGTTLCTHGPDTPPKGMAIDTDVKPVPATASPNAVICDGDGASGPRTQVMYVRASDRPDRFSQYLGSFRQWASDMDEIYYASAQETGGVRRSRFVTDTCVVSVLNVVIGPAGDDNFNNTISELNARGFNRSDRKYLAFVDENVLCGIGTILVDDRADQSNPNNTSTSYARVDAGCWGGFTAAHENLHNLGGVQRSAPHATPGFHCWDESDVMCYNDGSGPVMQQICATSHENRFDCNHDDYYHTSPPGGSYLASHWNTANSRFLIVPSSDPWTFCANENQTCSFSGTRQVRYGANGQYAYRTATGSIGCNNSVFGDPISGVVKQCQYSNSTIGSEPISLTNPGFEAEGASQGPTGWGTWGPGGGDYAADYTETYGGSHSGSYHLTHYAAQPYEVFTYQKRTGLVNGTYTVQAWVRSNGGLIVAELQAKEFNASNTILRNGIPVTDTWAQITIANVQVTNGQLVIGFYSKSPAYRYVYMDDITLVRN